MKKVIIAILIILAPAFCQADVISEIFEKTGTLDVTSFKENPGNRIYGITVSSHGDFIEKTNVFFKETNNRKFKDWEPVNNSYCISFFNENEIYALCISGITVVVQKIK